MASDESDSLRATSTCVNDGRTVYAGQYSRKIKFKQNAGIGRNHDEL
jgi:hypothetical protein